MPKLTSKSRKLAALKGVNKKLSTINYKLRQMRVNPNVTDSFLSKFDERTQNIVLEYLTVYDLCNEYSLSKNIAQVALTKSKDRAVKALFRKKL